MNAKRSVVLFLSAVFVLATSSFAQAGPKYHGSHHGYAHNSSIVIESREHCPEDRYGPDRRHHKRRHYKRHSGNHRRSHWKRHHSRYDRPRYDHGRHRHGSNHVYIEKHVYRHESPRVIYRQPQRIYYPPVNNYRSNHYSRDVVGEAVAGGAFGAAAGAAIGAIAGNPGKGAALGAVIGGFNGISRGAFGRGILW